MGLSRIFWDSNLFIYFFEGNDERSLATKKLRRSMLDRGDQLLTSTLTLGEILVKPLERGDTLLCKRYQEALSAIALIVPFDLKVAHRYAAVRSSTAIKAPDAIQLACAAEAGVDLFVTNDRRLQGKQIEGIQFVIPLDRVPI
jgi:predicted nucleic acid-binding protein